MQKTKALHFVQSNIAHKSKVSMFQRKSKNDLTIDHIPLNVYCTSYICGHSFCRIYTMCSTGWLSKHLSWNGHMPLIHSFVKICTNELVKKLQLVFHTKQYCSTFFKSCSQLLLSSSLCISPLLSISISSTFPIRYTHMERSENVSIRLKT